MNVYLLSICSFRCGSAVVVEIRRRSERGSVGGMIVNKTGDVGFEDRGEEWLEKEGNFSGAHGALKQYEDCGIK
jgi:hypothetical protein